MGLGVVLVGLCLAAVSQEKKLAVPDAAEIKSAEQTIRDLFKEEYAKKTPADRRTLARKLLAQVKEAGNAPASQYALYSQAIDLSIQAVDVETSILATTELTTLFDLNSVAQRATTLSALGKAAKTPDDSKTLARAYLQLADDALKADDFDAGSKAAAEAGAHARRAKDQTLTTTSDVKVKDVTARKARFDKVKKAKESLDAAPDDPAANLAVGQYYCFVKGDWPAGLACLAKAPDGNLKAAAVKDLANPEKPEDQALVGDGWWDLSETAPPEDKGALRDRAGTWYRLAGAKSAGLGKVKIDKRLAQWNNERAARGIWVDFSDPSQYGLKGKAGDPLEVIHTSKGTLTPVNSKAFPAGEFDGFTLRVRLKMDEPGFDVLWKGPGYPNTAYAMIRGKTRFITVPGDKGVGVPPSQMVPLTVADEYVLTVLNAKGEDTMFLNGLEIAHYPNTYATFDSFTFHCHLGTTTIDKIKLRRK